MKTNELMTGDWVRVREDGLCIPKDTIVKIRAIDELDLQSGKIIKGYAYCRPTENDVFPGEIWVDYLEPIPLTAKILEKNGFEKCEDCAWSLFVHKEEGKPALYQIYWSTNGFYLEISSYTSQSGDFSRMGIQFVHELQHAIRLCRIDKTIEL